MSEEEEEWQHSVRNLCQQNGWIIIAISGVTNSGKSTICSKLKSKLSCSINNWVTIVNQDDHYWDDNHPNHTWIQLSTGQKYQNWEILGALNWKQFQQEILETIMKRQNKDNNRSFMILDGHILLNYRPIANICHRKYFIDLDKAIVTSRRSQRNYTGGHTPSDPIGYFEECVWLMYLENKSKLQLDQPDIVYIDGSNSIDDILEQVYNDLKNNNFLV